MDTKYTTDGKKVVVIGKLNAQETIVQEVFFIGESEIPSGEHFVTKSLHDAPAVSWKETEIKKLDERLKKAQKEVEKVESETGRALEVMRSKLAMLQDVAKNVSEDAFTMARDVLTGRVKWAVFGEYRPRLMSFDEFEQHMITRYDNRFEGFKLLSLYGNYPRYQSDYPRSPKGNLKWRLHNYSDGSGSSQTIFLFVEKSEALEKLQEMIDAMNGYDEEVIATLKLHGLPLNQEKLQKYEAAKLDSAQKAFKEADERFQKAKDALAKVQA